MTWWHDDMMTWWHDDMMTWWHDDMIQCLLSHVYRLKCSNLGEINYMILGSQVWNYDLPTYRLTRVKSRDASASKNVILNTFPSLAFNLVFHYIDSVASTMVLQILKLCRDRCGLECVNASENAAKQRQIVRISSAAELKWRTTWQTVWPASPSTPRKKWGWKWVKLLLLQMASE